MKTITINKNFKVEVDDLNKTLKQKYIHKQKLDQTKTKESYRIIGHYNTWEQVFIKMLDLNVLDKLQTSTIEDLMECIVKAKEEIVESVGEIDKLWIKFWRSITRKFKTSN